MPDIEGHGWELKVTRLGLQSHAGEPTRTYSSYKVFIDGTEAPGLSGHMCERTGPGDNSHNGDLHDVRIREGRYRLSTQFGKYRSTGFSTSPDIEQRKPMPAFLLLGTQARTGILVHPAHPNTLYISSVGCFNPTQARLKDQMIDFFESRGRVIDLLESLRLHDSAAFAHETNTAIANAFAVIDGEPMSPVPDDVAIG